MESFRGRARDSLTSVTLAELPLVVNQLLLYTRSTVEDYGSVRGAITKSVGQGTVWLMRA